MAEAAIKKPKFDAFLWEGVDKQGKKVKGIMEEAAGEENASAWKWTDGER